MEGIPMDGARWVINQKANREDVIPKKMNVIITGSIGECFSFVEKKKTVSNILYVAFLHLLRHLVGWLVGTYIGCHLTLERVLFL